MEICDQCGSFGEIQSLCVECGKIICCACSGGFDQCEECRRAERGEEGASAAEG
ncbi:MAG TPA: hypothetical protein GXZ36_09740 [Firmicutes bacterium]|nr:hypothetical protein [Bacillota bacterium]